MKTHQVQPPCFGRPSLALDTRYSNRRKGGSGERSQSALSEEEKNFPCSQLTYVELVLFTGWRWRITITSSTSPWIWATSRATWLPSSTLKIRLTSLTSGSSSAFSMDWCSLLASWVRSPFISQFAQCYCPVNLSCELCCFTKIFASAKWAEGRCSPESKVLDVNVRGRSCVTAMRTKTCCNTFAVTKNFSKNLACFADHSFVRIRWKCTRRNTTFSWGTEGERLRVQGWFRSSCEWAAGSLKLVFNLENSHCHACGQRTILVQVHCGTFTFGEKSLMTTLCVLKERSAFSSNDSVNLVLYNSAITKLVVCARMR